MRYFPITYHLCSLLFFSLGITTFINGQQEDFQSWNIISLSQPINSKYTASLTTISRINDNVTRFNDISFDWRVNRKFKNGLSAQVSFRNWVFLQNDPIYFVWYDMIYVKKRTKYKWVNLLRLHHGLDWGDREQADFIRMKNYFFVIIDKANKLAPFIGYDVWYKLSDDNRFQLIWLDSGIEYTMHKLRLRLNYRRIAPIGNAVGPRRDIILMGLFYTI